MASLDAISCLIDIFDASHVCICSMSLRKIKCSNLSILCDLCGISSNKCSFIWHCPAEFNIFHPDGYDICDSCITQLTVQKTITNIDHSSLLHDAALYCGDIQDCHAFQSFIKVMQQFNSTQTTFTKDMDTSTLLSIVNDHLHLMQQHDSDDQFKVVYGMLKECDVSNCAMFNRNNRNRIINSSNDDSIDEYNVACCLMDKMHCHFQHDYDLGNRVMITESDENINHVEEVKDNTNSQDIFSEIIEKKKDQINKAKKHKPREIYTRFTQQTLSKYNLMDVNEDKIDEKPSSSYGTGEDFFYGYDGEIRMKSMHGMHGFLNSASVDVSQVFGSFKDELMNNPFVILTVQQYNSEYGKASVYIQSSYCKQHPAFQSHVNKQDCWWNNDGKYRETTWDFGLQYLLAMMIYCNYTVLQSELSKTYIVNGGANHKYFYHWGKLLKICAREFSTKICDQHVNALHHGTSKQFWFAHFVGVNHTRGIPLRAPFSTSSSFAVAFNFAQPGGMVLSINARNVCESAKCLSISFLSDFPGEKEYLFVQNPIALVISNITDITTNCEYETVLQALSTLNELTNGVVFEKCVVGVQDDSIWALIKAMVEHQLSKYIPKLRPFESLTELGKHLLNSLFLMKESLHIHYWKFRKYGRFPAGLLHYTEYEWMNLEVLMLLFPYVVDLTVSHITLSTKVFENILGYLQKYGEEEAFELKTINIEFINPNNEMCTRVPIQKYSSQFRKYGWFMYLDIYRDKIIISACSVTEFVIEILNRMNELYYEDVDGEIEKMMESFINNWISGEGINIFEEQLEFNKWCNLYDAAIIDWKLFSATKESYLYKRFVHPKIYGWINLNIFNKVFPNVNFLMIKNGSLSEFVMDEIYDHLKSGVSSLSNIEFEDSIEHLTIDDAKKKYESKFNAMNWRVSADVQKIDVGIVRYLTLQMLG